MKLNPVAAVVEFASATLQVTTFAAADELTENIFCPLVVLLVLPILKQLVVSVVFVGAIATAAPNLRLI